MKNSIESWRFKARPSQEDYEKALETMKERLMKKKNITNLNQHKFLIIEDPNAKVVHMWLVPKEFKE